MVRSNGPSWESFDFTADNSSSTNSYSFGDLSINLDNRLSHKQQERLIEEAERRQKEIQWENFALAIEDSPVAKKIDGTKMEDAVEMVYSATQHIRREGGTLEDYGIYLGETAYDYFMDSALSWDMSLENSPSTLSLQGFDFPIHRSEYAPNDWLTLVVPNDLKKNFLYVKYPCAVVENVGPLTTVRAKVRVPGEDVEIEVENIE